MAAEKPIETEVKGLQKQMNYVYGVGGTIVLALSIGGGVTLNKFFDFVGRFGSLEATAARSDQVIKVEGAITHQTQDIARIEQALRDLAVSIRRSDRLVGGYGGGLSRFQESVGEIHQVTKDSITLKSNGDRGKAEITFPVAPGARIVLKSKSASLDDLKKGMRVVVLYDATETVQLIEDEQALERWPQPVPAPK